MYLYSPNEILLYEISRFKNKKRGAIIMNQSGVKKTNKTLSLILLTALISVVTVLAVFHPLAGNLPFTVILPIVVLSVLNLVFFEKLKLSTLIITRILILLPVLGYWNGDSFVKIILPFMAVNILEASIVDWKRGKKYNATTGFAMIATLLLMTSSWHGYFYTNYAVCADGSIANIATWIWAIVYTFWNWYFIAVEFKPGIAFLHVGILASPIILGLIYGPEYWMVMRAYSLTFGGGVIQIYFKNYFETNFTSAKWERFVSNVMEDRKQKIFMIINILALASMYFFVG